MPVIDLLNLTKKEMRNLFETLGEPAYRAAQVERWLYHELATNFSAMTNLPNELRARLAETSTISAPKIITEKKSADGLTHKALLQLADGQTIETVLMLYADAPNSPELDEPRMESAAVASSFKRRTVCISTQVGCPIGCPFCATGQAGYIRNLTPGEIIAQVLHFARTIPLTNVVVMGMGEPFMKFDVTWQAITTLTDETRFGMSARRITVSTAGEIPGIEQMAREKSQVNLAVSLHAPDDELRDVLVPLNRKYPLKELMRAIQSYTQQTHRRVTFEYALMDGINDQPAHARALAQLVRGSLCHINLIPLNPTSASPYGRPSYERVKQFEDTLRAANIPTTLRVEKGIEIAAGCGQLRQTVPTNSLNLQIN